MSTLTPGTVLVLPTALVPAAGSTFGPYDISGVTDILLQPVPGATAGSFVLVFTVSDGSGCVAAYSGGGQSPRGHGSLRLANGPTDAFPNGQPYAAGTTLTVQILPGTPVTDAAGNFLGVTGGVATPFLGLKLLATTAAYGTTAKALG